MEQLINVKRSSYHLPQEIITEILMRSPAKSLLRFKCVSKSWFSEISSPGFAKSHVKVSSKNKITSNYGLVFPTATVACRCSLDEEVQAQGIIPIDSDFHNWGCCNGWICFSKDRHTHPVLWNPSTRKVKGIRRSPAYLENRNSERERRLKLDIIYGFGYDEFTDDYKVIEIVDPGSKCTASIYNLRKNYWKILWDCPKSLDDYSFLVNGALHWKANHKHKLPRNFATSIFWINMSTETYGELGLPEHDHKHSITNMRTRIGVLRDCLCASFNYFYDRVDVWIMKEYGAEESWYKFVSVPHNLCNDKFTRLVFMQRLSTPPVWLFENGEILLVHELKMVCYNPRNNTFKRWFPSRDLRKSYWDNLDDRPECYVESLISLD
ncbi:F-box/kelch-repeat protein At3g23880-like [Lycium barbarum]|uniref:F-box/kelch-repeat protein At3g23880-like n=1 Tax=Lycium barbarum TaxID=112863 RepID=UPI00293F2151|nr:F-box/kelch-repeat protein At3g23880-like [Lycium barbarum]